MHQDSDLVDQIFRIVADDDGKPASRCRTLRPALALSTAPAVIA
jgi:hypothetical protein